MRLLSNSHGHYADGGSFFEVSLHLTGPRQESVNRRVHCEDFDHAPNLRVTVKVIREGRVLEPLVARKPQQHS